MASFKVPFLTSRTGKGGIKRYFWQPTQAVVTLGFALTRVPDDHDAYADPHLLEAAAIAAAQALNDQVEARRQAARQGAAQSGVVQRIAALELTRDAIRRYRASRYFLKNRDSTKQMYNENLDIIEAKFGDLPWRAITAKVIEAWYVKMQAQFPTKANHVVSILRVLLSFAATGKLRQANAASAPGLIGIEPSGKIWPREAVALFVETADALGIYSVGTAIAVNEWIGQREGDLIRLKPPATAAGNIILRQSKRGAGVLLPITMVPHLAKRIDEEKARRVAAQIVPIDGKALPLILDERTAKPYASVRMFQKRFADVRDAVAKKRASFPVDYIAAGSPEADDDNPQIKTAALQIRHTRHTAIVRIAEAEGTRELISAITGQSLAGIDRVLKYYLVLTRKMATQAFQKRLDQERAEAGEG